MEKKVFVLRLRILNRKRVLSGGKAIFQLRAVTHFVDEPLCPSPTNLQRSSFAKGFGHLLQDDR
jgi:hypothetical protein